ncbi:serine/threonine-protein kinase [Alteribacillus iranensis]|uniref:non-specific serine/threonine protein kinase n=1 Tax=Alteribacillus iranensis TaxID=930128 RepID=A0A1I2BGS9_9BACI|nr:serine/threonine-protein kinase [Alteribacillus iranensis]SFE55137.1 Serine/threonine protein kinase [Alteribacillus iranensis]
MLKLNHVNPHLTLDKWKAIGGEGKNSEVWIARDKQLEQVLVLKVITKLSLEKQNVEDFFLESKILNEANHPHIMPINYSAEDDKNIYITMPYYEKGSINSLINKEMLSVREITKYSIDFLSGLMFLHIKGLVHLDIKPTNIMLNDSNRAILTDFGLSRYLNEYGLTNQEFQYRIHRSPESFDTSDKSITDDIYQAGLTMYRMCNGNENFKEQYNELISKHNGDRDKIVKAIRKGEFPHRRHYLPHIPKKLRRIINKMLHPDVSKRYQEVLSIINDLSNIEELLEWKYEKVKSNEEVQWTYNNEKSIIIIKIEKRNSNKFVTLGNKYIKSSGNTQRIRKKVEKSHSSFEEAMSFIESVLLEYS